MFSNHTYTAPLPKFKEVVPQEFFAEYMESKAAKHLDVSVVEKRYDQWIGKEANVHVWWILDNGIAIGWNENPSRGWSFPVKKYTNKRED